MWDPLLQRQLRHGTLIDSQVARQKRFVLCALDPPRHAMTVGSYRLAQHSTARLYGELQERRHAPMPVGLQEEPWVSFSKHQRQRLSSIDEYIDGGGFGIVAALLSADPAPQVFRLETGFDHDAFGSQVRLASQGMLQVAEVLTELIAAFDRIAPRCSPRLARLVTARRTGETAPRVETLVAVSRELGTFAPPELVAFARVLELRAHSMDTLQGEEQKLEQEIRTRGQRSSIAARPALEIYLHDLKLSHGADPQYAGLIRACRSLLEDFSPHLVDEQILRKASSQVSDAFVGVRISQDEQHRHLGHSLKSMHLLELATVLGIDVDKYPTLRNHVYAAHLQQRLSDTLNFAIVRRVLQLVDEHEAEVWTALVETALDREVTELLAVTEVLAELRLNRIGYGPKSQEVLRQLRLSDLAQRLAKLDPMLSPKCLVDAAANEDFFGHIIELNESTIRRGKLMGRNLLWQMNQRKVQSAILACDGFHQEILADLFRADVDYSMLVPEFSD